MSLLKRIAGNTSPSSASEPTAAAQSSAAATRPDGAIPRSASVSAQDRLLDVRHRVQRRLTEEVRDVNSTSETKIRQTVEDLLSVVLDSENIVLSRVERQQLVESLMSDIVGLGPLDSLLKDESISEIMVNGPNKIYIEQRGKLTLSGTTFIDDEHAMRVLYRIVSPLGRRIDESSPMVDARLQDGSRVNAVIRPISLIGPVITIRKFSKKPLGPEDLIRFGAISREMMEFLSASVRARINVVVSGGTGSGKTTLLNVLSSFIPEDERLITVENAAELQLQQDHVISLESRTANIEGKGEISINDLIINCLRMRPERIIVGECRGGETLAMLQAMNTGHEGSMTTLHANTPRDAIARIETMCLMSGMDLPLKAIREQVASAIELIVQQARLKDGSRRVMAISEVTGMEGDLVVLQDIFIFEQTGLDERGKIVGSLRPTGVRPRFLDRFEALNIYLPPNVFGNSSERFY
ncbi:MAG TPA: CpaF family protein [Herpetosiphon sp.]|uniref:Type II secretion system protein E n=1 Tax=Herpetosiphon aurantiacus (strain ATCC 23779 / DSM 785 / 114-95) TaxID=316274 RepID=A9B0M6_HERA2|nr:CpaF family protein [Herpetosiphon sp.]ABX07244.1 type II secretion system protein E [Herpetosiphon aurantiacus DSM 785]HBW52028.1 CpaF family protein [Herpetosiphon sp.]